MFQELFDGSPLIQEIRKVSHDQGLEEGIRQERQESIQNLQTLIVKAVQDKYPFLSEYARKQVIHFNSPEDLNSVILKIMHTSSPNTIRDILGAETGI